MIEDALIEMRPFVDRVCDGKFTRYPYIPLRTASLS